MAESVDAEASKAFVRKDVRVRVPLRARTLGLFFQVSELPLRDEPADVLLGSQPGHRPAAGPPGLWALVRDNHMGAVTRRPDTEPRSGRARPVVRDGTSHPEVSAVQDDPQRRARLGKPSGAQCADAIDEVGL